MQYSINLKTCFSFFVLICREDFGWIFTQCFLAVTCSLERAKGILVLHGNHNTSYQIHSWLHLVRCSCFREANSTNNKDDEAGPCSSFCGTLKRTIHNEGTACITLNEHFIRRDYSTAAKTSEYNSHNTDINTRIGFWKQLGSPHLQGHSRMYNVKCKNNNVWYLLFMPVTVKTSAVEVKQNILQYNKQKLNTT